MTRITYDTRNNYINVARETASTRLKHPELTVLENSLSAANKIVCRCIINLILRLFAKTETKGMTTTTLLYSVKLHVFWGNLGRKSLWPSICNFGHSANARSFVLRFLPIEFPSFRHLELWRKRAVPCQNPTFVNVNNLGCFLLFLWSGYLSLMCSYSFNFARKQATLCCSWLFKQIRCDIKKVQAYTDCQTSNRKTFDIVNVWEAISHRDNKRVF